MLNYPVKSIRWRSWSSLVYPLLSLHSLPSSSTNAIGSNIYCSYGGLSPRRNERRTNMKPDLLYDTKVHLGEGPIWDAHTQTLYWVDIFDKRIYAGSGLFAEIDEYEFLGCIAPREKGGFILALNGDSHHPGSGHFHFASLETDSAKLTL